MMRYSIGSPGQAAEQRAGRIRAAMSLVDERYPDFEPTFAADKLSDGHGLALSRETLRK